MSYTNTEENLYNGATRIRTENPQIKTDLDGTIERIFSDIEFNCVKEFTDDSKAEVKRNLRSIQDYVIDAILSNDGPSTRYPMKTLGIPYDYITSRHCMCLASDTLTAILGIINNKPPNLLLDFGDRAFVIRPRANVLKD
jgi:hypothetical protein